MIDYHIVGCGLPRTGTSSLRAAIRILEVPKYLRHVGDHIALRKRWRRLDQQFPNAKFILTLREDGFTWLKSVENRTHIVERNEDLLKNREMLYGSREVIPALYLKAYQDWNDEVFGYFKRKYKDKWEEKLLPVCWEINNSESNWSALCRFLGVPVPNQPFPHRNRSKK